MQELWERALKDLVELLEKWIEVVPPYLADLFQRYATYWIFKESFLLILSIIAVVLSCYGWYKIIKADEERSPLAMFLIIPLWFWVVWLFMFGIDLFEAIFIPEVYIIHDLQWCTACRW